MGYPPLAPILRTPVFSVAGGAPIFIFQRNSGTFDRPSREGILSERRATAPMRKRDVAAAPRFGTAEIAATRAITRF